MYSDSIKSLREQDLFLEALRTLPVPVERHGTLTCIANGVTPPSDPHLGWYSKQLSEQGIIPFLEIEFNYEPRRNIFLPDVKLEQRIFFPGRIITQDDLEIQGKVSKAVFNGSRPNQYTINLPGYGIHFGFERLQAEFLGPLAERGYPLTEGELWLRIWFDERGGYSTNTSLEFHGSGLTLSDRCFSGQSEPIQQWFNGLKEKYQAPEQQLIHPS